MNIKLKPYKIFNKSLEIAVVKTFPSHESNTYINLVDIATIHIYGLIFYSKYFNYSGRNLKKNLCIFIFDRSLLSRLIKRYIWNISVATSAISGSLFTQYILISDDFMCLLYRSEVHNGDLDLLDCKFYKSSFMVQKLRALCYILLNYIWAASLLKTSLRCVPFNF